MRLWIVLTLRRLADWLAPPAPPVEPEPVVVDALTTHAAWLIQHADLSAPGTSGEYKRHLVYAALQKAFPGEPKRRLSLLIETTLAR